jgi:micrococcal nuclease
VAKSSPTSGKTVIQANPSAQRNTSSTQTAQIVGNRLSAQVVRGIDGDTFVVNLNGREETSRMILIYTPETVVPNKTIQLYDPEAGTLPKSLLEGKTLELELDLQERNKYSERPIGGRTANDQRIGQNGRLSAQCKISGPLPPNRGSSQGKASRHLGIENYVHDNGFYVPASKAEETKPSASAH